MPSQTFDPWQFLFFAGGALLVVLQAWRGWRLGVIRQCAELLGVVGAYLASYFFGRNVAPLFRVLHLPDPVLTAVAGGVLGLCVYLAFSITAGVAFKRTAQQNGAARTRSGVSGAVLGAFFGVFMLWLMTLGIRICGSFAEAMVKMSDGTQGSGRAVHRATMTGDPGWVRGLVHLKQNLESGATGAMMKQMDPLPATLYATIARIGVMFSNPQSVERFLTFPEVKALAQHPKVLALSTDPEIVRYVEGADFMGLLHNPRVIAAANDAEVASLLRRLDFQKALDYALGAGEKPRLAPPPM
jgi:uncharacterized membrane protein required for colicin V production